MPRPFSLTDEQVQKAHKVYETGESLEKVASEFGTTRMILRNGFIRLKLSVRTTGPKAYDERKVVIRSISWPIHTDPEKDIMSILRKRILKEKRNGDSRMTMKALLNKLATKGLEIYQENASGTYSVVESDENKFKRLNEFIYPAVANKIDGIVASLKYKHDGHEFRFYSFSEFYVILIDLALKNGK